MNNQYYIDKDKQIDIRVDHWSDNRMHVSIYNDRNDSCIGYTCNREELMGLADFLNKICQLNVAQKVMEQDSEALRELSK